MQIEMIKNDSHPSTSFTIASYFALIALFVPTFYKLFSYGWDQADYSHGPLILAVFLWLIWKKREFFSLQGNDGLQAGSLALLIFGLSLYALGVTNRVIMFEAGSMIPVMLGAAGFLHGRIAQKILLFPVLYLVFLVPPPLFLIDFITSPLKLFVAAASVPVLTFLGYPVSRDGVLLLIGDYSIVIGDACSGMRSLVSLLAVGALYAWPKNIPFWKKSLLFLSVIPIAIIANIVRLVLLAIITYYFGDSSGQKFFHDYSPFFLFVFSLASLVLVDLLLDRGEPVEDQI